MSRAAIVATHHGRIACFLNRLCHECGREPLFTKTNRNGLMNLAVVKTAYDPSSRTVTASLLYRGVGDGTKKEKYHYLKDIAVHHVFATSPPLFGNIRAPIVMYLIRHGIGRHNVMTSLNKIVTPPFDPFLVSAEGLEAAAGAIAADLAVIGRPRIVLLSSPLRRCLETMAFLMVFIPGLPMHIHVLPCLHEVSGKDKNIHPDGRCDTRANRLLASDFMRIFGAQNTSRLLGSQPGRLFQALASADPKQIQVMNRLNTLKHKSPTLDWSAFREEVRCSSGSTFLDFIPE